MGLSGVCDVRKEWTIIPKIKPANFITYNSLTDYLYKRKVLIIFVFNYNMIMIVILIQIVLSHPTTVGLQTI